MIELVYPQGFSEQDIDYVKRLIRGLETSIMMQYPLNVYGRIELRSATTPSEQEK